MNEQIPSMDSEWIQNAAQGDREAFGNLVRAHQGMLRAYASQYVPSSADVLDIVQDTFVDVLRGLPKFDLDRPLAPWLRTICRNRVRKFYRSRHVHSRAERRLVDEALAERVAALGDEEPAARVRALRRCLEKLDPSRRELIQLRYHQGVSVQEIADQLGKKANTVSMMLSRLRGSLNKCVESIEGGTA